MLSLFLFLDKVGVGQALLRQAAALLGMRMQPRSLALDNGFTAPTDRLYIGRIPVVSFKKRPNRISLAARFRLSRGRGRLFGTKEERVLIKSLE